MFSMVVTQPLEMAACTRSSSAATYMTASPPSDRPTVPSRVSSTAGRAASTSMPTIASQTRSPMRDQPRRVRSCEAMSTESTAY